MSKTYEVKMGMVEGSDHHHSKLTILPIVKDMASVLAAELKARGWSVKGDVATKTFGEADVTVNTETGDVDMSASAAVELVGRGYDVADNEKRGRAAARADGERRRASVADQAKAKAQKALLDVAESVREDVNGALRDASVAALRRKAASLGTIQSETEMVNRRGERELVIKVKV